MTASFTVTVHGLREIRSDWERLRDDALHLGAVVPLVRRRWNEAEERIFDHRTGWAGLKRTTRRRYRTPVRGHRGGRQGLLTGQMRRVLTTPGAAGARATATGNLTITLGPKTTGDLFYIGVFNARRRVVAIDDLGLRQATADVSDHLLFGRHASRS